MKIKLVFLSLTFLGLGFINKQTTQTLHGRWRLICFSDLATNTEDCKKASDPTNDISLTFEDNGKTGKLYGNTISNVVEGTYTLGYNNKINVVTFGGTKVKENGWGENFWTTIQEASSFKYSADTLVILYDHNTKAMKFLKN